MSNLSRNNFSISAATSGLSSRYLTALSRPWSFESGSTSLHRAAAAPKDGRLPPARGGEREWSCLSLHRFASTAFPLFAAGVDEPLPASLSVALHLQPQPTFARDSHRSSGEDPGQCRAAPRPPAKGTPRPRPPNRIPSYPCVHHFTPRTRSIATFRSSLTVFRSSPIHRPSVPASSTVRIPTADHVNAQYTPSSPHTQFLNQWRSLPITFIREERARPRPLSRRRRRHFGSRLYSQRSSLAPPA